MGGTVQAVPARDVDLIVGHTRDECRLFLVMRGRAGRITEEDASRALSVFGPGQDGKKYRDAFPDATAEQLYVQVQTDWIFRMPTLQLAEAQTAGGGRAYLYELAWEAPGAGGMLGACHGLDLPLLFGTFGASLGPLLFGPEPPRPTPPRPSSARRGRRSPRPATPAGPRTTRSTARRRSSTRSRPWPPTPRTSRACCGRTSRSRRSRCSGP